jgi:nucleotide-binding universal stress UspA family protein
LERDLHEHYRAKASSYLNEIAQKLPTTVPIVCDIRDEHIDIPEAIETEVVKVGIDLIVMPSHGRSTLKRYWFGSIADDVYRSSSVPVLLTRPLQETVDWDQAANIRRILVSLDGTPEAEQVLESVLSFGQAMAADFLLVRVVAPPLPQPAIEDSNLVSPAGSFASITDQVRADPQRYLQAIAAQFRSRGARVQTQVLASNEAADAIIEAAAGTDLIAMQTHARGGVSRLVHGSIVEQVVNKSTVPVLINRPHKK